VYTRSSSVWARDLSRLDEIEVAVNESGDLPTKEKAAGFEWSEARQAFLWWRRGDNIYELKPPAADWKSGTWIWTAIRASSGSQTVPFGDDNGVYSRFRIASYEGLEVAVVVGEGRTGAVYAFRLPQN